MPVGTVRGRFELDAPALRTLRDLEKQGIRTNAQMKALGKEMDRLADQGDRKRIENYRKEVRRIGPDTAKALIAAESAWAVQTKRINKHIDSQIARVELLHQRIQALGRTDATAHIGVRGGASTAAAAAFGAGAGSGANRIGGGGGGQGMIRSLNLGPLNLGRRAWPVLATAGLPLGAAGAGWLTGVAGSAGLGAVGAGAVGTAGIGTALGGFGSLALSAKPAATAIGEMADEQERLNDAIADFGAGSTQARAAAMNVRQAARRAPRGTRALLRERAALGQDWRRRSRPAQEQFVGLLRAGVRGGRRIAPAAAEASLVTNLAARRAGTDLTQFATGRWGERFLGTSAEMFAENLPPAERSLENILKLMLNLQRASRPFFLEATRGLEGWTEGWADGTSNIRDTREEIGEMLDHLRSWGRLARSTGSLTAELLGAGAPAGQSSVERLTDTFDRWEGWLERNPAQTRDFFRRSTRGAEDFASAMWDIVRAIGRLSDDLLPVLTQLANLTGGASALGLLTPGALALGIGARRGFRGAAGGRGAAGPVSLPGAGAAPFLGGGAALLGARGALGAAGAGGAAMRGGGFLYRHPTFGISQMPGSFVPGGPVSQAGQRARGLGRVGALAGGPGAAALRGAGKAFLPVGIGLGILDFAGFEGNFGGRLQAAASTASLGIIQRPLTGDERQDQVMRRVDELVGDLPRGQSGRAQRRRIRQLRSLTSSGGDAFAGLSTSGFLGVGGGGPSTEQMARGNRVLREQLEQQVAALRDYRANVRDVRLERTRRDIARAFNIRLRGEGGAEAIEGLQKDVLGNLRGLGRRGQRQIAQNAIGWARAQARGNPELLDEVRDLERGIIRRFRRMGREVKIINGQIFTGSRREWGNIADALGTAAERARQEVTQAFTAIQRQALGSLRTMGFSPAQARALVRAEEGGGPGRRHAREYINLGAGGSAPSRQAAQAGRNARGGRIWGAGTGDNVRLPGGGRAAPGEAVLSADIEAGINADLWRAGKPPVGARLGRGRPHYRSAGQRKRPGGHTSPPGFARGGIVGIPWDPGESAASHLIPLLRRVTRGFQADITDAFGPGHQSPGHTRYGTAVDFVPNFAGGGDWDDIDRLVRWAVGRGYKTLYDGRFGSTAWPDHGRGHHAHIEFGGGGGARGIPGGGLGGVGRVNIRAPGSRLRGAPGAMSGRAQQLYAGGLERQINRRLRGMGGGDLAGFRGGGSAGANRQLARRMMIAMGWPASEWSALNPLWTGESNFNHLAVNPSSGATGIPQSLPGSKMASEGADWRTNPATQIRWGLKYIRGRYGSPSAAYQAWLGRSPHWYARGGRIPELRSGGSFTTAAGRGQMFMAGDNPYRKEQVTVRPIRPRQVPALAGRFGGGGGGAGIHFDIKFGDVTVRSDADLQAIAEKVADVAGRRVLAALGEGDPFDE